MSDPIVSPEKVLEIVGSLRSTGEVSEEEVKALDEVAASADSSALPEAVLKEKPQTLSTVSALEKEDNDTVNIRQLISDMKLPDKIKAAMLGNSVCRAMLITDTNRMIQQCVLKNPKITEKEIEEISKNPNMPQGVLRTIAEKKEWTKNYIVKVHLVTNPKTPVDLALKWLKFLNATDLRKVAKTKSVSNVISTSATKKVAEAEQK